MSLSARFNVVAQKLDDVFGRSAGKKYFRDALFFQLRNIFLWNDAADEDEAVVHSFFAQQLDDARAESVVSAAQDRHTDGVHVFLERGGRDHLGRLAQTGVDDFHAGVAEGGGDDLRTAIMPVETWFGD